jgi:hypothetical protein
MSDVVDSQQLEGRTVAFPIAVPVHLDDGLITSRGPKYLPAFCAALAAALREVRHAVR